MERICKSAPEIKGLSDARPWFQALLLTNNREEPFLANNPIDARTGLWYYTRHSKERNPSRLWDGSDFS